MARWPRLDREGLTLPAWAISILVILVAWGMALELRISQMEDRLVQLVGVAATVEADHDRVVAIEARAESVLRGQESLLLWLRRSPPPVLLAPLTDP